MPSYDWSLVINLNKKKEEFGNDSELMEFWNGAQPNITKWLEFCGWTEYAIGLEWGMEGRLHFQCYFKHNKIKNKKSVLKTIKRLTDGWPTDILKGNPDLSNAHSKTALVKYVTEPAKNRVALLHKIDMEEAYLGEDLPAIDRMPPWYNEAIRAVESITDTRQILWIYDPSGGAGKTKLAKHLCLHTKGIPISYGKASDILHIAASNKGPLYVVNLPRAKGRDVGSQDIYQALEGIRDGFFIDTKYKSKSILRKPSKIIVFANIMPTKDQLKSQGRYWVCQIIDGKLHTVHKDFDPLKYIT